MDCSVDYIKMCEKAEKIQKSISDLKDGDFIADWRFKKDEVIVYHPLIHDAGFGEEGPDDEFTWWLPRQDQLQEIIQAQVKCHGKDELYWKINWFWEFVQATCFTHGENYGHLTEQAYPSMEQLWLAFVMKEKYKKVWDGKEWKEEV